MEGYQEIVNKWKRKEISSPEDLDFLLENFNVLFAYNSDVVEDPQINYFMTKEVIEEGRLNQYTGSLRAVFEIYNEKKSYEYVKERVMRKEALSPGLIETIHSLLMQEVGDGRVLSETARREMRELCGEMEAALDPSQDILEAAAYLHCKVCEIYAKVAGGGRTSRVVTNYFLLLHNYPPVIFYQEKKGKYQKALDSFAESGSTEEFVEYLKDLIQETWEIGKLVPEHEHKKEKNKS